MNKNLNADKSAISNQFSSPVAEGASLLQELEEEVDLLSTTLESLVKVLEEKVVVTQAEWEKRLKENVKV